VQGICCDEHGDRVIFIGLSGKSSREFRLNPKPPGPSGCPRISSSFTPGSTKPNKPPFAKAAMRPRRTLQTAIAC
jgi:hypothetical protein